MDEKGDDARRSVVAAWLSMWWLVPAFFAAFFVGEGLISLFGYDVGGPTRPPLWAGLAATIPALVVFALPLWPVWHFSRRAVAGGRPAGRVPLIVTAVIVAGFVILNLVPMGQ
ncbi:MAG: hypothetical protein LWW77_08285 [Propionibacteriales bacterium]|nr:hypothetical protein [Propionibacteriales bacterium]